MVVRSPTTYDGHRDVWAIHNLARNHARLCLRRVAKTSLLANFFHARFHIWANVQHVFLPLQSLHVSPYMKPRMKKERAERCKLNSIRAEFYGTRICMVNRPALLVQTHDSLVHNDWILSIAGNKRITMEDGPTPHADCRRTLIFKLIFANM